MLQELFLLVQKLYLWKNFFYTEKNMYLGVGPLLHVKKRQMFWNRAFSTSIKCTYLGAPPTSRNICVWGQGFAA